MDLLLEHNRTVAERDVAAAGRAPTPQARLTYERPTLAVYGPVAAITATVGTRGRKDAKRSRRRTGF